MLWSTASSHRFFLHRSTAVSLHRKVSRGCAARCMLHGREQAQKKKERTGEFLEPRAVYRAGRLHAGVASRGAAL